MASGTPMVSFGVGGVSALVRPGITGYLAESGNAQNPRDGVVQLLEDQRQRTETINQYRAITVKDHKVELWVQRYIELYRQLLRR